MHVTDIAKPLFRVFVVFLCLFVITGVAMATEGGGSTWPVGAESTHIAAAAPTTGKTQVFEYTCFYTSNQMIDGKGNNLNVPDFHVRVLAVAIKLEHNWGIKVLGGELDSYIAVPMVYQQLHVPAGKYTKDAITNVNITPLRIVNHKMGGKLHYDYEFQLITPATGYSSRDTLNIGQNNAAFGPAFSLSYLPNKGKQDLSFRTDYIVNRKDGDTGYHSGNEFFTHFVASQTIPHTRAGVGLIGYFYKQMTDDRDNGAAVVSTNADGSKSLGYRGRQLDLGAQVTLPWGKHGGLVFNWEKDTLVQNKARGNAFWFKFGIPFSYLHHPSTK